MSKLETNVIDTLSGTSNLTIGSTNSSTVTFENGAVTGHMYPAFEAHNNDTQTVTDNTFVKVSLQTEILDTDSCFDNSTNYRFTPTVAGKYYIEGQIFGQSAGGSSTLRNIYSSIYKNGTQYKESRLDFQANEVSKGTISISAIIDFNGSSDYVELYAAVDTTAGAARVITGTKSTYFLGYRIGA